jgi:Domain of unknown function (DUF4159)
VVRLNPQLAQQCLVTVCRHPLKLGITLIALVSIAASAVGWQSAGRRYLADREGVPVWDTNQDFKQDVFTFARVQYSDSYQGGYGRRWRGGGWATDYPTSDLNFSLRLQQLTSIQVNPHPVIVRLTDENLTEYPFLYLIEPGSLTFSEPEVQALRNYCLKGGFLMVDDFWGDYEYENLYRELKRVFPNREPREIPLEHEIFQCVYPLRERPQVPSVHAFERGMTYEPRPESDTSIVHYLAIEDDSHRIMVFICHNTDLGDGWEREGENRQYFAEYAVKKSYPLGINIVTYAMTH